MPSRPLTFGQDCAKIKDVENIPLNECLKGHLYRVHSRNLSYAVFNGETGFVGIRLKFSSRFLDTEYHWDTGPPHGTLRPLKDMGAITEDIEPVEGWWDDDAESGNKWRHNPKLFKYLDELY